MLSLLFDKKKSNSLILPNNDRLQDVENDVRGCTWQLKERKFKIHKLDSSFEYFNHVTHNYGLWQPTHNYGLWQLTHNYGLWQLTHNYGLWQPTHKYGLWQSTHSYGLWQPTHSYGLWQPTNYYGLWQPTHNSGLWQLIPFIMTMGCGSWFHSS